MTGSNFYTGITKDNSSVIAGTPAATQTTF